MSAQLLERVNLLASQGKLEIEEASKILGVSRRTLYAWRATGYGPKSVKYANKLWYRAEDLYRFIADIEAATAKGAGL